MINKEPAIGASPYRAIAPLPWSTFEHTKRLGGVPRKVVPLRADLRQFLGDMFAVASTSAPLPPPPLRFGAGTFPPRGDRHAPDGR